MDTVLPKEREKPIDLNQIFSWLEKTRDLVKQLARATEVLPVVDEEGHSECEAAEEVYAQKEEVQEKALHYVAALRQYLSALDAEISRCEQNKDRIATGHQKLHGNRARACYHDANRFVTANHFNYVQLRERVRGVLAFAEEVLREAAKRRFPGRAPRRKLGPPAGVSPDGFVVRDGDRSGPAQELADLFGLGQQRTADPPATPGPLR